MEIIFTDVDNPEGFKKPIPLFLTPRPLTEREREKTHFSATL